MYEPNFENWLPSQVCSWRGVWEATEVCAGCTEWGCEAVGAMLGLPSPESLSVRSVHLEDGACLRAAGVLLGGEREESLAECQVRRGL